MIHLVQGFSISTFDCRKVSSTIYCLGDASFMIHGKSLSSQIVSRISGLQKKEHRQITTGFNTFQSWLTWMKSGISHDFANIHGIYGYMGYMGFISIFMGSSIHLTVDPQLMVSKIPWNLRILGPFRTPPSSLSLPLPAPALGDRVGTWSIPISRW